MTLRLSHTTLDVSAPYETAEFWRVLLDWKIAEPEDYRPDSTECYLVSPHGYTVLFMKNPDEKRVKNRIHFDLVPDEGSTRDEQVKRAVELGATLLEDRRQDLGWAVLADPEGNEFCILEGE